MCSFRFRSPIAVEFSHRPACRHVLNRCSLRLISVGIKTLRVRSLEGVRYLPPFDECARLRSDRAKDMIHCCSRNSPDVAVDYKSKCPSMSTYLIRLKFFHPFQSVKHDKEGGPPFTTLHPLSELGGAADSKFKSIGCCVCEVFGPTILPGSTLFRPSKDPTKETRLKSTFNFVNRGTIKCNQQRRLV
jgi:hypothetical protein